MAVIKNFLLIPKDFLSCPVLCLRIERVDGIKLGTTPIEIN